MIRTIASLVLSVVLTAEAQAQRRPEFRRLGQEAVTLLSEYLRLQTVNPPGNEAEGARFLAQVLKKEGIPHEVFESAPGRGNIYARLKGDGSKPPLILLHHIDVVPASPEFWRVPPFSGEVLDGYVWGRGALDTKGLGIVHLATFLALKRSGAPLKRDVIFLATADEEAGGYLGVDWILKNRPELVRGAEFVLNEGGDNILRGNRLAYVGVETTQKVPFWLRLRVKGITGHGSIPRENTAPDRLVRALNRILDYQPPLQVTPAVGAFFRQIAPLQPRELRQSFLRLEESIKDPDFVKRLSPFFRALLRNTISLTVLKGSEKTNVIPPLAMAELDCRLLPAENPDEFLKTIASLINDPEIEIETLLRFKPAESPTSTVLFEAIRRTTARLESEAAVGPTVLAGFTDSHFFREMGITSYGFEPFKLRDADSAGVHGNDERISIDNIHFGVRYFYEVIAAVVY